MMPLVDKMMNMTSRTSQVFYENSNPQGERKEGNNLTHVLVTDNKVIIHTKRLVKTTKSESLFEKIIGKDIFSLHENGSGTKYLKHFRKNLRDSNNVTDISLKSLTGNLFESPITLISDEGLEFVEKTILDWFGYDYRRSLDDVIGQLLFPALRSTGLPSGATLPALLSEMQKDYGTITPALRANESWLAFIMDVCKPTMESVNDAVLVDSHLEELLPVAMMNFGTGLSALCKENKYTLLQLRKSFMNIDFKLINFMFKYLPSSRRAEAIVTLLSLIRAHDVRRQLRNPKSKISFSYVDSSLAFNKIPMKLRFNLAEELLKSLTETHSEVSSSIATSSIQITTELCNVFRYWFAQMVLEPSLKTEVTVEALESRFQELLGIPLPKAPSPIEFVKKNNLTFCLLTETETFVNVLNETYRSDVFTDLKAIVKKLPSNKSIDAGYYLLNGYVAVDGDFMVFSGKLYSLDDMLQIIEDGINIVDTHLRKLGRNITPENRLSFLTLGIKEREYKGTWRYYDLGVTDPQKILKLKKSKVRGKKDIQTYNALPDEMFNEFLAWGSADPAPLFILIDEAWSLGLR